jgi:hypothetical protein
MSAERDALGRFVKALEAHTSGPPGIAPPTHPLEHLVRRRRLGDPHPDEFTTGDTK